MEGGYQLVDGARTNSVDDVQKQLQNEDDEKQGGHGSGWTTAGISGCWGSQRILLRELLVCVRWVMSCPQQ